MILYPEILHRAQQEIDAVGGRDRLPTFDDADDLPYVEAIIREILRWRPSLPLSKSLEFGTPYHAAKPYRSHPEALLAGKYHQSSSYCQDGVSEIPY